MKSLINVVWYVCLQENWQLQWVPGKWKISKYWLTLIQGENQNVYYRDVKNTLSYTQPFGVIHTQKKKAIIYTRLWDTLQ